MKSASTADAPFLFTVNYGPSIAQLSIKDRTQVIGEEGEIFKVIDEHKQNKPPLVAIIQAVSSIAMAEAILLSKSLGIPSATPSHGPSARTSAGRNNRKDRENRIRVVQLSMTSDF